MKSIKSLLNQSYNKRCETFILIRKVWQSTIPKQVVDITSPACIENKKLLVFVHDNIWIPELNYLTDVFIEKLNENGLDLSTIEYKYKPKYEENKIIAYKEYEITDNIKNYIENTVKKIDNKQLAESCAKLLTALFKRVNFKEWRAQ